MSDFLATAVPIIEKIHKDALSFTYLTLPQATSIDIVALKEYLKTNEWPMAMIDHFIETFGRIGVRYLICDDSGSMSINDGSRLMKFQGKYRSVNHFFVISAYFTRSL
jgi:hypothetical protein